MDTKKLASKGRGGDDTVAHVDSGETIVPKRIAQQRPDLMAELLGEIKSAGRDPGRYVVGGADDSINPKTGLKEFEFGSSDDRGYGGDDGGSYSDSESNGGRGNMDRGEGLGPGGYGLDSSDPASGRGTYDSDRDYGNAMAAWAERDPLAAQAAYAQAAADREAERQAALTGQRQTTWDSIREFLGVPDMAEFTNDPFGTSLKGYLTGPTIPGAIGAGTKALGMGVQSLMNALGIDYTPGPDHLGPTSEQPGAVPGGQGFDALNRFLSGGAAPEFDPVAATRALTNSLRGITNATTQRQVTGRGFEQPAITRANDVFNSFSAGSNYDAMLNEMLGGQFANEAFDSKQGEFRTKYTGDVNTALPEGELFDPDSFNSMVDNFLNNKFNESSAEIGRYAARGNLNTSGVGIAQNTLRGQRDAARAKVDQSGRSVNDKYSEQYGGIRGRALGDAGDELLHEDPFDVSPYKQERDTLSTNARGSFDSDVSNLLGAQPLFDVGKALQSGGAQQGQVSGGGPNAILDTLSQREQQRTKSRGLGTSGSGVF